MNKKEYLQANKDWLTAKAKEQGVRPLQKGVYYKVLTEGNPNGKHPSPRSVVVAHYTGCTINGKQFDTSRGGAPLAIRLCELIEGWVIALQQMCGATNGKCISPPKWDMANARNRASPEAPRSSLK